MRSIKSAKKIVMTITNTYIKRSIISEAKFREFVRCLFLDLDPNFLTGLNRNTANRYFILIRMRIAEFCSNPLLLGKN